MIEKFTFKSILKSATLFLFAVIVLLAGYFMYTSPVAFQKSVTITFVDYTDFTLPQTNNYVDIKPILEKIPFKSGMVYEILPKEKYSKTILEGYGNCSNLAFGLAYYLRNENHNYQIVHVLPPDGFLNGDGHTVINIPYKLNGEYYVGIVDVLEGGLPQSNNTFLNIHSLRKGGLQNPSIFSFSSLKDSQTHLYGNFLDRSVIGVIPGEEVNKYFDFIESVYIPLGSKRIEKLFYDGLAVIFGYYPSIYVIKTDSEILFRGHKIEKILSLILLISIRLCLVFATVLALTQIITSNRYRKPKVNIRTTQHL